MVKFLTEIFETIQSLAAVVIVVVLTLAAVTWLAARDAILTMAPVVVYVIGSVIILAAVVALAVFVVERVDSLHAARAEKRRDRTLADNEARRSDLDLQRDRMHLQFEEVMLGGQARQILEGLIYGSRLGDASFASHAAAVARLVGNDGTPLLTEPQPDLLPAIINLQNVLVVGGKGSGKTTLLQWIEAARVRQGKVIVLDSHTQPSKWQGTVVGIGRNYKMIRSAMVSIVNMLNERYQVFSKGQSSFEPVTTFIDEFTMLPKTLKESLGYDIQQYSVPVLTEGRKVSIAAVWGIHSDRAKILGLEGMADLKECFDVIVKLVKVEGRPAYALVDFGEGVDKDVRYRLPGPFIVAGQAEAVDEPEPPLLTDDMPTWGISPDDDQEAEPSEYSPDETARIVELFNGGDSLTAICTQIHGYKNQKRIEAIKAVLRENNLIG